MTPVKLIVAGSRTVTSMREVERAINKALLTWGIPMEHVWEVVSGGAKGVDRLGEQWAARNGLALRVFPVKWSDFGKAAGPRRNAEMAEYGTALVAVWDGESPGTADMIRRAQAKGMPVHVHRVKA